jgi:calcineurin-like phosphoesterase family protein
MHKIYLTSDLHFGHTKEFLWGPRGFTSSAIHDEAIIANWNSVVGPEDEVYVLGDLMLGDYEYGLSCLQRLNGTIHVVRGNHDTDNRWARYHDIPHINPIGWAHVLRYRKYLFHLSHWPTDTANYDDDKPLKAKLIGLSGHTHKPEKFHNGNILKYNVALDAHNNYPVLLDDIIEDIKSQCE